MNKVIKFETHKELFEQSWGRCLKRSLTPNKKLVALNNVKIAEDSKRYSLIKAFRKSIKDLRDINDFKNLIFLVQVLEEINVNFILKYKQNRFYIKFVLLDS
ncbi:hypothetical protein [Thermoanaerobacter mathranii]|uniref:hypothetical protein n=1 Tax=Thermoanaerobacter mathranii TaxID=583357 RepID=UPI003AAE2438